MSKTVSVQRVTGIAASDPDGISQRKSRVIEEDKTMAVVEELIRSEAEDAISFGNHTLKEKAKKEDFEFAGDLYKVKTFGTMTKLEKNGMFLYESVPGTSVTNFREDSEGVSFEVEGDGDAQLTLGLAEDTEYQVSIGGTDAGKMKTNLGGKLSLSVELSAGAEVAVSVRK